jgi:hypothetical protein
MWNRWLHYRRHLYTSTIRTNTNKSHFILSPIQLHTSHGVNMRVVWTTLTGSYERPLVPDMIQINSPPTPAAYSFKIYSKILPSTPRSSKRPFSPQVLPTKVCCPTRATCPAHLIVIVFYYPNNIWRVDHSGRTVQGVGLQPLACWDCGLESRRGHGCLSLESVVLSGTGLCVGLITCPEEFYRVWCVWVWSWILENKEALVHCGAVALR